MRAVPDDQTRPARGEAVGGERLHGDAFRFGSCRECGVVQVVGEEDDEVEPGGYALDLAARQVAPDCGDRCVSALAVP